MLIFRGSIFSFPFGDGVHGPFKLFVLGRVHLGGGGMKSNNGCEESVFLLTQAENMSNSNGDKTLG